MDNNAVREMLAAFSKRNGVFAQLYQEHRMEHTASKSNGVISDVRRIDSEGLGLMLIRGTQRVYLYTTDVSERGVMALLTEGPGLLGAPVSGAVSIDGSKKNLFKEERISADRCTVQTPIPYQRAFDHVTLSEKLRVLERAEEALRASSQGLRLLRQRFAYSDSDQAVTVIDSEGRCTSERRLMGRVRVYYALEGKDGDRSSWMEYVRPAGFELFDGNGLESAVAARMAREKSVEHAVKMEGGVMPVVFAPGEGGTFWHECCGHQLEAPAIASGNSDFVGKIGECVASEKVTLIDDGTISGAYGSSLYDDEGSARRSNVLIENGVLKNYLCDRYFGSLIGEASNGCGRRENYTFAPTARMSNTYLAAGTDDPEEMIREIPYGLYVKALGGGSGGSVFSILCSEGYVIRNGKIAEPVQPCMLTGRGEKLMHKVDRVGNDLKIEQGSFCGAASGLVPVTASCPTMRISEMMVR